VRTRLLLAASAVVLVAGTGFAFWVHAADRPGSRSEFAGEPVPAGSPAQDFALRDQSGRLIRLSDQRGHLVLLAFLYTHCTDICPLIAKQMDNAVRSLGPQASSVRILAVSVDPAGDTPVQVRRYVRRLRLGPKFHYLLGTKAELAPIWQGYNVAIEGRPSGKVVHAAPVWLIDRSGRPRLFYAPPQPPGAFAHDLRAMLEQPSR
jgi:protein SCO1/2